MPDLTGYRFTSSHEWVTIEGREAIVGISDHAQSQLGDVIFVELPQPGRRLVAGERFGTVESVKAASDLYAPVGGRIVAVNDLLQDNPQAVNEDAFGEGWLIRLADVVDNAELLDAAAYARLVSPA